VKPHVSEGGKTYLGMIEHLMTGWGKDLMTGWGWVDNGGQKSMELFRSKPDAVMAFVERKEGLCVNSKTRS